jgi:hypothetical protein
MTSDPSSVGRDLPARILIFPARCSTWPGRSARRVVSVEYRLAPETSHPGPVEDAHAGISQAAVAALADWLGRLPAG